MIVVSWDLLAWILGKMKFYVLLLILLEWSGPLYITPGGIIPKLQNIRVSEHFLPALNMSRLLFC